MHALITRIAAVLLECLIGSYLETPPAQGGLITDPDPEYIKARLYCL